jgi:hypothetical protein
MPISGGKITVNSNSYQCDTNGRIISLKISYRTDYGTYFEVDGDVTRTLEVKGSVDYVKD